MIRLLKWLIFGDGHLHKWIDKDIMEESNENPLMQCRSIISRTYIRECEHCGKIKEYKVGL